MKLNVQYLINDIYLSVFWYFVSCQMNSFSKAITKLEKTKLKRKWFKSNNEILLRPIIPLIKDNINISKLWTAHCREN
jgi:hypothetical protein